MTVAIGALIIGLLGAFTIWVLKKSAEAQGRAEAEREEQQKVINAANVRAQVETDNNALTTDALRDKLLNDK